nr:MAG TPA: hypothetical protein [Bacteriophage sp.]
MFSIYVINSSYRCKCVTTLFPILTSRLLNFIFNITIVNINGLNINFLIIFRNNEFSSTCLPQTAIFVFSKN